MTKSRQPLLRPLRLRSRNKWMEDKEFTVDDQGTQKVLRDCTEDERQYILDTGWDIVARESPHSAKLERSREWASQMKEHTTDEKE